MDIGRARVALAFGLLLSCCLSSVQAQPTKSILGVIEPGHTTLAQFEYALRANGCHYSPQAGGERLKSAVRVEAGCFDLPGDPVVQAEAESETLPVESLNLTFKDKNDESLFQLYSNALGKSYGEPNTTLRDDNQFSTMWRLPQRGLVVDLGANRQTHDTWLKYSMGILGQTILKQWQKEETSSRKTGKDLANL